MKNFRRLNLVVGAAATLALVVAGTASGQHSRESFQVRGASALQPTARVRIAQKAEPFWVESRGQRLFEILEEVCGEQPQVWLDEFKTELLRTNGAADLDAHVARGLNVVLPACFKVEKNAPVKVEAGDTLEGLLKKYTGTASRNSLQEAFRLNVPKSSKQTFEQFSRSLKPGRNLTLPTVSAATEIVVATQAEIPPKAESVPIFAEVASGMPSEQQKVFLQNISHIGSEPEVDDQTYEYVEFVSSTSASQSSNCDLPAGTTAPFWFDVVGVKEALQRERARAPRTSTAVVGIIDSGLAKVGDGFFDERFFHVNEPELNGGSDDDNYPENGYKDDVWGINLNDDDYDGWIEPYGRGSKAGHGTKVAAVVLGGDLQVVGVAAPLAPPIGLVIVNYSSTLTGGTVSPGLLPQAVNYLAGRGASVVNMSLKNRLPAYGLSNEIRTAKHTLFVVAAGNVDSGSGLDLNLASVFPARFGGRIGENRVNSVTVGAHTRDGGWARFSNYSVELVDLMAPGCSIPTRDETGASVTESGTSMAAATVSFTAGLMRSLHQMEPQEMKSRLLASVDVDPRLERYTWSSGRLNIVKAVSLRHDVVEFHDVARAYEFGNLRGYDGLIAACSDDAMRRHLSVKDLRKIRPNLSTPAGPRIEYWIERYGVLTKVSCEQRNANEPIGTWKGSPDRDGPPLKEVKDIVLAMP